MALSTTTPPMSMRVLINDYPHRTLAIATDTHALLLRHTHAENRNPSSTSLPLSSGNASKPIPRCMVEFSQLSDFDFSQHRNVAAARGTLGVITLNNDVFLCIVTGSVEAAALRPGETIQRIYSVEFYCLNRSEYDHSHGHPPNPLPGQQFASEEFDYGSAIDASDTLAEHPFHALQKLLSGGNFYYSVDFDLTRRLQDRVNDATLDIATLDDSLLWNSYMINPLLEFRSRLTHRERDALDSSKILTSVIRGFARTLTVPPSSTPIKRKLSNLPASITVISRLSSRRAGTRFNSRGIDDNGNVANFVETETIFWSPTGICFSYVQVRGSVPLFWESASSLIPGQQKISISRSPEATQPSFDKHFAALEGNYGAIHIVNLLSNSKPGEVDLTQRYQEHIRRSPLRRKDPNEMEDHHLLRATEFDFHEYARGGGFDVTRAFRPYIESSADSFVYFLSEDHEDWTTVNGKPFKITRAAVIMQQNGVFRVNCLDCLDRTNLVQGMISKLSLELFLSHRSEKANSDFWMRHDTLWADNGDALSKIYAGTGALKSSFTRHGKMSLGGALADVRKSATRLYVNHFEDKGRQNTVDLLLGRLVGQSSVDLFDPVNDWVVAELYKRRHEFESRAQVKVFVGTFNLNGKSGGTREDLTAWLHPHGAENKHDIVVVGFQEIVELSPQQIMSTDPNRRMVWESAVRACLNNSTSEKQSSSDDFVLLRSGQLVGAALLIFIRASILPRISNVEGAIKKTGMSGIAGNKGAVACRMDIDSTSVCFVTAHLAAGFGNYEERNRDYRTITEGLRFGRERGVEDHEIIVWAGDFNYRIGLGDDKARALVTTAQHYTDSKREDALGRLYENDQLNIQMVAGNCFDFYREGRISFLPTYKFDLGTDKYDSSEKARIPAWTDRVLWKVNHQHSMSGGQGEDLGTNVRLERYDSVQTIRVSDHRPVYATFEVGVRVIDDPKKEALTRKLYQKRAKEVRAAVHAADDDDASVDSSDLEDVVGYEAIQEGLPPASSDRRKWWLDNDRSVRAEVKAPAKGVMLNPMRKGNPWRSTNDGAEEEEEEWIKIEKVDAQFATNGKGKSKPAPPPSRNASNSTPAPNNSSRSSTPKPDPPQPRKRPLPPAWEGQRTPSSSTITSLASTASGPPPALPTRPNATTSSTNGQKYAPPPPAPRSGTPRSSTPNLPQTQNLPQPQLQAQGHTQPAARKSSIQSFASTSTGNETFATPPSTSSGPTAAAAGVPSALAHSASFSGLGKKPPPPPKPSKPSALASAVTGDSQGSSGGGGGGGGLSRVASLSSAPAPAPPGKSVLTKSRPGVGGGVVGGRSTSAATITPLSEYGSGVGGGAAGAGGGVGVGVAGGALRKAPPPALPTRSVSGTSSDGLGLRGGAAPAAGRGSHDEDKPPPPLPRRVGTLPSVSTAGVSQGGGRIEGQERKPQQGGEEYVHPPARPLVKQRKGSQLVSPTSPVGGFGGGVWVGGVTDGGGRGSGNGDMSGVGSGYGQGAGTGGMGNQGLMDRDEGEGGGLGGWEVLKPR